MKLTQVKTRLLEYVNSGNFNIIDLIIDSEPVLKVIETILGTTDIKLKEPEVNISGNKALFNAKTFFLNSSIINLSFIYEESKKGLVFALKIDSNDFLPVSKLWDVLDITQTSFIADELPEGFVDLKNWTISRLFIKYNIVEKNFSLISFLVSSINKWPVCGTNNLFLKNMKIGLDIIDPLINDKKKIFGDINSILCIDDIELVSVEGKIEDKDNLFIKAFIPDYSLSSLLYALKTSIPPEIPEILSTITLSLSPQKETFHLKGASKTIWKLGANNLKTDSFFEFERDKNKENILNTRGYVKLKSVDKCKFTDELYLKDIDIEFILNDTTEWSAKGKAFAELFGKEFELNASYIEIDHKKTLSFSTTSNNNVQIMDIEGVGALQFSDFSIIFDTNSDTSIDIDKTSWDISSSGGFVIQEIMDLKGKLEVYNKKDDSCGLSFTPLNSITIPSNSNGGKYTLHLNLGQITFCKSNQNTGESQTDWEIESNAKLSVNELPLALKKWFIGAIDSTFKAHKNSAILTENKITGDVKDIEIEDIYLNELYNKIELLKKGDDEQNILPDNFALKAKISNVMLKTIIDHVTQNDNNYYEFSNVVFDEMNLSIVPATQQFSFWGSTNSTLLINGIYHDIIVEIDVFKKDFDIKFTISISFQNNIVINDLLKIKNISLIYNLEKNMTWSLNGKAVSNLCGIDFNMNAGYYIENNNKILRLSRLNNLSKSVINLNDQILFSVWEFEIDFLQNRDLPGLNSKISGNAGIKIHDDIDCVCSISLNNDILKNEILLYPNQKNTDVSIKNNQGQDISFKIYYTYFKIYQNNDTDNNDWQVSSDLLFKVKGLSDFFDSTLNNKIKAQLISNKDKVQIIAKQINIANLLSIEINDINNIKLNFNFADIILDIKHKNIYLNFSIVPEDIISNNESCNYDIFVKQDIKIDMNSDTFDTIFKFNNPFLKFIKNIHDKDKNYWNYDLNIFGVLQSEPLIFKYFKSTNQFISRGVFTIIKNISLPVSIIKSWLNSNDNNESSTIPDCIEFKKISLLTFNNVLKTQSLIQFFELYIKEKLPENIITDITTLSNFSNAIPDNLKKYLEINPFEKINFEIIFNTEGMFQIKFDNIDLNSNENKNNLIKNDFKFLFASKNSSEYILNGIQINNINILALQYGSFVCIEFDIIYDQFNISEIASIFRNSENDKIRIKNASEIKKRIIAKKIMLVCDFWDAYNNNDLENISFWPLFFNKLAIEYMDIDNLHADLSIAFPKPKFDYSIFLSLLKKFRKFLLNKDYLLQSDDNPDINFSASDYLNDPKYDPEQMVLFGKINSASIKLPQYFGNTIGIDEKNPIEIDDFNKIIILLNSLKILSLKGILSLIPLKYKSGNFYNSFICAKADYKWTVSHLSNLNNISSDIKLNKDEISTFNDIYFNLFGKKDISKKGIAIITTGVFKTGEIDYKITIATISCNLGGFKTGYIIKALNNHLIDSIINGTINGLYRINAFNDFEIQSNEHGILSSYSVLRLNSINDYIESGNCIPSGDNFCFEAWIFLKEDNNFSLLYVKNGDNLLDIAINKHFIFQNNKKSHKLEYSGIKRNKWTHIAASYDGRLMRLYIDGKLVRSHGAEGNLNFLNSICYIGKAVDSDYFDGFIKEIRIWNKVRKGDEIIADMHKELSGNEENLYAYWQLNYVSEKIILDKTSRHLCKINNCQWLEIQEKNEKYENPIQISSNFKNIYKFNKFNSTGQIIIKFFDNSLFSGKIYSSKDRFLLYGLFDYNLINLPYNIHGFLTGWIDKEGFFLTGDVEIKPKLMNIKHTRINILNNRIWIDGNWYGSKISLEAVKVNKNSLIQGFEKKLNNIKNKFNRINNYINCLEKNINLDIESLVNHYKDILENKRRKKIQLKAQVSAIGLLIDSIKDSNIDETNKYNQLSKVEQLVTKSKYQQFIDKNIDKINTQKSRLKNLNNEYLIYSSAFEIFENKLKTIETVSTNSDYRLIDLLNFAQIYKTKLNEKETLKENLINDNIKISNALSFTGKANLEIFNIKINLDILIDQFSGLYANGATPCLNYGKFFSFEGFNTSSNPAVLLESTQDNDLEIILNGNMSFFGIKNPAYITVTQKVFNFNISGYLFDQYFCNLEVSGHDLSKLNQSKIIGYMKNIYSKKNFYTILEHKLKKSIKKIKHTKAFYRDLLIADIEDRNKNIENINNDIASISKTIINNQNNSKQIFEKAKQNLIKICKNLHNTKIEIANIIESAEDKYSINNDNNYIPLLEKKYLLLIELEKAKKELKNTKTKYNEIIKSEKDPRIIGYKEILINETKRLDKISEIYKKTDFEVLVLDELSNLIMRYGIKAFAAIENICFKTGYTKLEQGKVILKSLLKINLINHIEFFEKSVSNYISDIFENQNKSKDQQEIFFDFDFFNHQESMIIFSHYITTSLLTTINL